MALARFFFPGGAYSATSAPVVATRAPTPMPVRNRSSPNPPTLLISAVAPMPTLNHAYAISMILRRPTMSATVPASRAPTSTPRSA
jgi:hypothetical protein